MQELIKKVYYKKRHVRNQAVIFLLRQEPGAFIKLYPDVQKQGVRDNYEFMRRLMYANLKNVENIDHPELQSLKEVHRQIKRYNLEKFVIKPGFIEGDDLVGFYNLATIYIQPSLYEGFGIPVLEAMSCGCPVMCSDVSSLPEVAGRSAVYFDPLNKDQFLNVMEQILSDKSLRRKLSSLGLHQAAKFSWERTSHETYTVFESIKRS